MIDQLLKYWISHQLVMGESINFLPGFMKLTYVINEGGAWSLFSGQVKMLIVISILVVIYLFSQMLKVDVNDCQKFIYSLMIGGAVGNLIDRLLLGYVIDMFELTIFNFPVFNIADIAVSIGAGLLIIQILLDKNDGEKGEF